MVERSARRQVMAAKERIKEGARFMRASRPATPWFESDQLETYLARGRFDARTERFIRSMAETGGAVLDLGDEAKALCDQAATETDFYFSDGKTHRVQDSWIESRAVRRLARLPQVRKALKAAYGRKPFAFQTLNFLRGSQQHLHSDTVHFSSQPERFMCGVWIALEDVRPDAGPLVYQPGSHTLPILKMQDVGVNAPEPTAGDYETHYVPRFAELIEGLGGVVRPALIKKGQAFVWAANLAHGGSVIEDPASTRRSLVIHYYFDDCVYYTPMLSNESSGRLQLRLPSDISNGLWRWPTRNGRPVRLHKNFVLATVKNRAPVRF
jgi:hypothetical protein